MGKKEIEALIAILQDHCSRGIDGVALGTWRINFDSERSAFLFDTCEHEGYCQERPAVVSVDGTVLDPGGPIE